jgi:DNA-binding transcriptional regulator LsrR (DeoR family)
MGFDARLLYEVAYHYYELGKTQEEIAAALGVSRSQVSRAMKQAREDGIVVIKLVPPAADFGDIQDELCLRFGLRQCVVVSGEAGPSRLLTQNLGMAGARYLSSNLKPDSALGISWGATLCELAAALAAEKPASRDIVGVPLLGGLGQASADLQVNDIAARVGAAFGGSNVFLHAPSIVDTPAARDTIMSDSNIRKVVDQWARLDAAVVGIGSFVPPSTLLDEGGFSAEDLDNLRQAGVVGDMCMSFFNIKGEHVSTQLEARMIGVSLAQLRSVECVVAIAGGVNKASAILGALRTGVVDALVTDDVAARKVLEMGR